MDITVSNFPTWTRSEVCHWGPPGREPTMLPSFLANFFPRSWAVWLGREHFSRDARAGSRLLPQSGSVFSPAVHGGAPESRQESSSDVSADLSSGGSCCVLLVFDSITRYNELYMDSTTPTACRPHRSSFRPWRSPSTCRRSSSPGSTGLQATLSLWLRHCWCSWPCWPPSPAHLWRRRRTPLRCSST